MDAPELAARLAAGAALSDAELIGALAQGLEQGAARAVTAARRGQ